MLHIISESLHEPATLQRYLHRIGHGHSLLLIEDAVFVAQPGGLSASVLDTTVLLQLQLFILIEDLMARGIALETTNQEKLTIKPVDYAGFVDLVVTHEQVLSW